MAQPAVPLKTEFWNNMAEWASRYNTWYLTANGTNNDFALGFVYYDGQANAYKLNDHAGNTAYNTYAVQCRAAYRDYYVDAIHAPADGAVSGFRAFCEGLVEDFIRNGTTGSKTSALNILNNGSYMSSGDVSDDLYSRECAYAVINHIQCARMSGVTLNAAQIARRDQCFAWSLGHLDQWVNGTADYCRPFMVGLTARALIMYFENVNQDARVIDKLKAAGDYIWNTCWKDTAGAWGNAKAFLYTDRFVVDSGDTTTAPDLNMLIAPFFGWLWYRTGEQKWRTRGDAIWSGGVSVYGGTAVGQGATATGGWISGAYLGTRSDANPSGKQYNQQLWWGANYVTWAESDPVVGPVIPPGDTTSGGLQSIPAIFKGLSNFAGGYASKVAPCQITIAAEDTEYTIYQPAADSYAVLIGCLYCSSVAHELTFYSGDNEIVTLEFDTFSGLAKDINNWPLVVSNRGEALKVASSAILPKKLLFYVAELKNLNFG